MDETGNVVKHGMDMAVPMALYTTAISVSLIYTDVVPPLALLALALLLAGPFLLYRIQRRYFVASDCTCGMWDLWRLGIVAIFFGTVFTLLATYGILEYVRPGYITGQFETVLETYKQIPQLKDTEVTETLEYALKNDLIPTAWEFSLQMFVYTNISGMLMGIVTSMLASRPYYRH